MAAIPSLRCDVSVDVGADSAAADVPAADAIPASAATILGVGLRICVLFRLVAVPLQVIVLPRALPRDPWRNVPGRQFLCLSYRNGSAVIRTSRLFIDILLHFRPGLVQKVGLEGHGARQLFLGLDDVMLLVFDDRLQNVYVKIFGEEIVYYFHGNILRFSRVLPLVWLVYFLYLVSPDLHKSLRQHKVRVFVHFLCQVMGYLREVVRPLIPLRLVLVHRQLLEHCLEQRGLRRVARVAHPTEEEGQEHGGAAGDVVEHSICELEMELDESFEVEVLV